MALARSESRRSATPATTTRPLLHRPEGAELLHPARGRPANVKEEDAADHHTPDFYIDDSGLDLGVKALTAMTLNYMRTRPAARAAGP